MAEFPHILDELLGTPEFQDDGTPLPHRSKINITGATVTDDGERINIAISGTSVAGAVPGKLLNELRTAIDDAVAGSIIPLKGWAANGDGGAGDFLIVSGGTFTDNAGTILVAGGYAATASKAAVRITSLNSPLNVKWWGAAGDGI